MKNFLYIDDLDRARTLLSRRRLWILESLEEPRTCNDLAGEFGRSSQQMYYHVKALEKAGLVDKVSEKRVRGIMQGYYRAAARCYGLSPGLVGKVGEQERGSHASLGLLRELARRIYDEVGRLAHRTGSDDEEPASLGMAAEIFLPDRERKAEFLGDVQELFRTLTRKYSPQPGGRGPTGAFRLGLACYPLQENREPERRDD